MLHTQEMILNHDLFRVLTSPSLYTFGIREDALQQLTHFQNPVVPSLAHYCSNFTFLGSVINANLPERCPSADSAIKQRPL